MKTIASLVLFALVAGCAADPADPGTGPDEVDAGTASTWLAGRWDWREASAGDTRSERYDLDRDGTATHHTRFTTIWVDYNLADKDDADYGRWSLRGGSLQLLSSKLPLLATPNCRLLDVYGKIFVRGAPVEECPLGAPALSDAETSAVGTWVNVAPATDTMPRVTQTLTLEADRALTLTTSAPDYDTETAIAYWWVDGDGVLRATWPDQTEVLAAEVTEVSGNLFVVCQDGDCTRFIRRK